MKAFSRVVALRRLLCGAGVAVLMLHALLTAFAPAELLLLSNHDHLGLGLITPQQWQDHLRFHLQQARNYLVGIQPAAANQDAKATPIMSLPWCDLMVQTTYVLATVMLPSSLLRLGLLKTGDTLVHPYTLDLSPTLAVPHLPPRSRA